MDIHRFIRSKQVGFPIQSAFESFNFTAIVNPPSSTKVVAITELDCLLGLFLDQMARTRLKLAIQVPTCPVFLCPSIEGGSFSTAFVLQISLHLCVLVAACLFIGGKGIWCPIKRARESFAGTSRLDCSAAFSAATTSFIATVIARHPAEVGKSGARTASTVLHSTVAIHAAGKMVMSSIRSNFHFPFTSQTTIDLILTTFTVEPRYNNPRYNDEYNSMSWQKLQQNVWDRMNPDITIFSDIIPDFA